jgi:putative peptide zinc metalloprotease protein
LQTEYSQVKAIAEDQALPRLRSELEVSEQIYDGQPYWVIKDPVSLRYYRFSREEYFILDQLRRDVTLDELKEAHREEFQDDSLNTNDVGTFMGLLMARNLVLLPHPNRDEILYRGSRRRWRTKFFGQLMSFMFFKIPLYDPDRLFNRIHPRIRFLWSRPFFIFFLLLLGYSFSLLVRQWGDCTSMFFANFFTMRNIPLFFLVLYFIKGLHEFGHGLTCKNYGGEVHEMGFLFLVFTPFLYCNVSDSWTFPQKHRRMLVTAGGIMTELFFASLATILWHFSASGSFFHSLMFNIMMACSISTVLFNANPLLKYDGYYLMMDLVEVPNLRQRASTYVRNLFIRYVLGGYPTEAPEEHRFRGIFPFYSIAAYCYRWFIILFIFYVVYNILSKVRLAWLGALLVAFSVSTMLVIPIARTSKMIGTRRRELGISNFRLLLLLVLIVGFVVAALFWPLKQHVTLNFILEPVQEHWVRSEVPGQLHWDPNAREGNRVGVDSSNQVMARLQNKEFAFEKERLAAEIEYFRSQLDNAATRSTQDQLQVQLARLARDRKRLQERIDQLAVRIPFRGEVLSRDIDISVLEGKYITVGEPLLFIGDTSELIAKVWVPEKTWARIFSRDKELGQQAELMLYAFSKERVRGTVSGVNRHPEEHMGEFGEKMALSAKVGGEVPTEFDPAAGREIPVEAVYEITLTLDKENLSDFARPYMSGRVRIDCGRYTLYQWGRESLLRFISPDVRL